MAEPILAALAVADPPERWSALGFAVLGGRVALGGVSLELGVPGSGITGWTLHRSGAPGGPGDIDGLRTDWGGAPDGTEHPNGALGVDHVVIASPDFDRTVAALAAAGLALRRTRQAGGRRQGFRRLGPAIMEIVEAPEAPATHFWGVTVVAADLELARAHAGGHLGPARPAVQSGRQIATVARGAGLSTRLAFMDPEH